MDKQEIINWLKETDEKKLEELWKIADATRMRNVGNDVHLRGLIEFSNYCVRNCGYCGLNIKNDKINRYRMTQKEIISCAKEAVKFGYGTVVLQSGEDYGITAQWMEDVIKTIKKETDLAITLSLGERSYEELLTWKKAGADRYLLRIETTNERLFKIIHPPRPGQTYNRFEVIKYLREIGYELGSGVMIGIPGQTYEDLADDIIAFKKLDLDMIGVGPYIAHPDSDLGKQLEALKASKGQQVPNTEAMTYKVVALSRIMCPKANIPSTTALATLNTATGRELGLQRGANIVMPNMTPPKYRAMYEIYPSKACIDETAIQCQLCMTGRIISIGREIGKGRGDSPNYYKPIFP